MHSHASHPSPDYEFCKLDRVRAPVYLHTCISCSTSSDSDQIRDVVRTHESELNARVIDVELDGCINLFSDLDADAKDYDSHSTEGKEGNYL